jgi:Core-2/I-Branching enzyme
MFRTSRPIRSTSDPELPLLDGAASSAAASRSGVYLRRAQAVLRARWAVATSLPVHHDGHRGRRSFGCGLLLGCVLAACVMLIVWPHHRMFTSLHGNIEQQRTRQSRRTAAGTAAAVLEMAQHAGLLSPSEEGSNANSALAVAAAALASLSSPPVDACNEPGVVCIETDDPDETLWTPQHVASWTRLKEAALAAGPGAPGPNGREISSPAASRIAFCFLTRGPLPIAPLWHRFFAGAADTSQFSIHVHAAPGFQLNASTVDSPLFYGRTIEDSVPVEWGQMSVVDAERRLFAAALADPSVGWVVLLSESCVPLRSFSFVREYLLSSDKSFLDSFGDVQGRYSPLMAPQIPATAWRKGTQWAALRREHASAIVADDTVFATMRRHCRTWTTPDGRFSTFCAGDEHYKQTLLVLLGKDNETHHRPVAFANWWPIQRSHPKLYAVQEVDASLLEDLRARTELWRPLEGEHLRCGTWNGQERRPCWLFARKFTQRAAMRMLEDHSEMLGL